MKNILLVDDEEAIRKMMRRILQDDSYEFSEAENGAVAIKKLEAKKFDLIITDVIMPDCDGIELVMNVRKKTPETKVIVMSGGGRVRADHYLQLAEKLGAVSVFEKPFDASELRETVRKYLSEPCDAEEKTV